MLRKSVFDDEKDNHERWLVSYADFITLLFAFFVVMYSISQVNEGKYRVVSESLYAAFESPARSLQPIQVGDIARENPGEKQGTQSGYPEESEQAKETESGKEHADILEEMEGSVGKLLSALIDADLASVKLSESWLEVDMRSGLLFESGSANLNKSAELIISELSKILTQNQQLIRVRGFTDNLPISTSTFHSNWELSSARAAHVVRILQKNGVAPRRMAVEGFGEYQPIADNGRAQGRARNRRVVLAISAQALNDAEFVISTDDTKEANEKGQDDGQKNSRQTKSKIKDILENIEETDFESQVEVIRSPRGGLLIKAKDDNKKNKKSSSQSGEGR